MPRKSVVERMEKLAKRRNLTLPASFEAAGKAAILAGRELFWIAYWELRSSTPPDEPIRWSERELWGRTYRLNAETRERLHELLASMDATFRTWYSKKTEAEGKKQKGPRGRGKGK